MATSTKLPPNAFVHEILTHVSKQRSAAKKVDALKQYRSDALTAILIWNFDDTVVSMLPDGEVPFNKNEVPVGTDHTSLRKEWKNLYHFVKGGMINSPRLVERPCSFRCWKVFTQKRQRSSVWLRIRTLRQNTK